MPERDPTSIADLKREFYRPLWIAIGICVVIWVAPIKPQAPNSTFRLLLTISFFAAAIFSVSRLLHPRERFALRLMNERYKDAPPQIALMAKKVFVREQQVIRNLAFVGIGVLGCGAVGVLSSWPQFAFLGGLRGIASMGFIGGIIALGYLVWSGRSGLGSLVEIRGLLKEMVETSDFEPGSGAEPPEARESDPVSAEDGGFRAGSFRWDWDDFHKNAVVFGQPGSGKTVCVLNAILDGLLVSEQDPDNAPAGLILDPKGDFRDKLRGLLKKYGRERDLRIIDPSSLDETVYWNPFDSDDDELELASRFASVLEILGTKNTLDTFWIDSAKKFMRHAIALIRFTNPADEPPTFREISRLAGSLQEVTERLSRMPIEDADADIEACLDFFEEWTGLGEKTRSSVQAQLTNMIDPFLMQPYKTVFGGKSTERIGDMLDRGRILYVYMPIADKEAMSRTICTLLKLEYFREVLKRVNKERQSFFLCDEFQVYLTAGAGKGDSDFFERSRQSRHANVIACQNIPALLKQTDDEKSVMNLLSNCAVKIFLRNTDQETNEYAANLFGQRLAETASISVSSGRGVGRHGESRSTSVSAEYDFVVRPEAFTKLGIPVRGNQEYCESIVHLASRAKVELKKLKWKAHPL